MKDKYYSFIDGLRAVAILGVLCAHSIPLLNSPFSLNPLLKKFFAIGSLGVDMFFVISGFLITGILIQNWEEPLRIKRFYIRRYFKIYPQYLCMLLAGFFIVTCLHNFSLNQIWYNPKILLTTAVHFVLLQNYFHAWDIFGHTWSLCIEEHFYLIYPIILSILFHFYKTASSRRISLIILSLISIILVIIFRHLSISTNFYDNWLPEVEYSKTTFFRIDAMIFGCLLKFLESQLLEIKKIAWAGWVFFLLSMWLWGYFLVFGFLNHWDPYLLAYLAAGSLFVSAYTGFRPLNSFLENKFVCFVGRNSYGIYLWHYLIMKYHLNFINKFPSSLLLLSYWILSFSLGILTTSLIEKYFLHVRKTVAP